MFLAALSLGGCAHYRTPGPAADFRALGITPAEVEASTDASIARKLDLKPLASFPATIAAIRVQGAHYRSYSTSGYGRGEFTVITVRDVETDEQFNRIASLPMVRGLAPVNRFVISDDISSERQLRDAAATVHADLTLLYTFETQFGDEKLIPALGLLTLGLFPDREARVRTTASAALLDTRNGYVYGLAESTVKTEQLANAWTSEQAIDQSRRRAETKAFDQLVGEVEKMWMGVLAQYGPNASPTAHSLPRQDAPAEPISAGVR
jgi:hypothetical protein